MRAELILALKKDVDLVSLKYIKDDTLAYRSSYLGKVLYSYDDTARYYFEEEILTNYMFYQEDVKYLFEDIKSRGSIYG